MTPNSRLSAFLLAATLVFLHIATATRAEPPTNQNAALALRPIIARYRELEAQAGYLVLTSIYQGESTPEEIETARAFIQGPARPLVAELIEATRIELCDWGIDIEQGPSTLLPHLGDMRAGAVLLCADARLRLETNDPAQAAENYSALFRLARHTRGTDPFLISALVEASIVQLACNETLRALDRGLFDRAQKQLLLHAAERFDPTNPHHIREAISAEGTIFVDWLRRTYQPGKPATESMRELAGLFAMSDSEDSKRLLGIVERGESIEAYLILLKGAFDAAVAAWDAPNAREALHDLNKEVQAGKYGPLASFAVADFSSSRKAHDTSISNLALLRLRLEE